MQIPCDKQIGFWVCAIPAANLKLSRNNIEMYVDHCFQLSIVL
jgi:hypothetical protein